MITFSTVHVILKFITIVVTAICFCLLYFSFSSPQQPDSEDEHQSPSMSIDEPSTSCDISGTSVDTSKTKSTETLTVIDVDGNQYDKPSGRII